TGIPTNHRKKLPRGLACRNPPGNHGSYAGSERKSQQLAREPAFDFWPGLFPNEIIPSQQSNGEQHPAVESDILIEPPPGAKDKVRVGAGGKVREQEEGYETVGC